MNMMEQFILIKKYYKMKKLILLSLFLKVVLTYGQSSTHTIAGIDLNNNWYDLTDLDTITYDMQERDKDENSIGVITTISERYLKENAEKWLSDEILIDSENLSLIASLIKFKFFGFIVKIIFSGSEKVF